MDYDVIVIGSGAGGGPVALECAKAGKSVLVLEKGYWLNEGDFAKDDLASYIHNAYTPDLRDEQHVIEEMDEMGDWHAEAGSESGWSFWNGSLVGGASNLMSGFFYRLKPQDFYLRSEFGPIEGANVADWPISYEDMEPWYSKVELEVGISGQVQRHPLLEPRSSADFPYPPTREHPIVSMIDNACESLGYHALRTPRAILSVSDKDRRGCEYSGFCGSYGCHSGAKGSSRAALLNRALKTGYCKIQPESKVTRLISNSAGKVVSVEYVDKHNKRTTLSAKVFVVACHAIESSRLLLASVGERHPDGLGNRYQQLGKNLLFSAGGAGTGEFTYGKMDKIMAEAMNTRGPFVNRGLQDWYFIDDEFMGGRVKGGTIDFLLRHPGPMGRAMGLPFDDNGLVWGKALKQRLKSTFTTTQDLRFEVFNDWLPTDNCFVSLDHQVKDKWGSPVARVRIGYHQQDLKVGEFLSQKAVGVMEAMHADNIRYSVSGTPTPNLVAGGCRFGHDPKISVLDKDCRIHDVDNVYVTDGSFMPTGGSVPYTWTIYANAFRVADIIKARV
ncbi:MAG: GMC family oxidoreductase [Gammaproteobacteria bacterium]|nr:GMC family oxidoreductase [Gammaproteobacteria bacterium]